MNILRLTSPNKKKIITSCSRQTIFRTVVRKMLHFQTALKKTRSQCFWCVSHPKCCHGNRSKKANLSEAFRNSRCNGNVNVTPQRSDSSNAVHAHTHRPCRVSENIWLNHQPSREKQRYGCGIFTHKHQSDSLLLICRRSKVVNEWKGDTNLPDKVNRVGVYEDRTFRYSGSQLRCRRFLLCLFHPSLPATNYSVGSSLFKSGCSETHYWTFWHHLFNAVVYYCEIGYQGGGGCCSQEIILVKVWSQPIFKKKCT